MLSTLLAALALSAAPGDEIRALLLRQAADWNRGDVEAFMQAYENTAETTFLGKGGITRGYRPVLDNYRKRYPTREAMGTLTFSEIEVRLVGDTAAVVLGRFALARTVAGGGPASGRYTLVLKRTQGAWKVIHDHTSAD
ncbi:MAG: nuclear transport factor 2 family protein [Acidobacteria bacterium]|nr:nuclear transport factor 2 family protein [Acidobacteriota bacterium]